MATVGRIRQWLNTLPDDAEFVVWWDGKEYAVNQVGHASDQDEQTSGWVKAGVFVSSRNHPSGAALRAVT